MSDASFLHDAGIAVLGGFLTAIGFVAKRRLTSAPTDETLQRKSHVLSITKSMADQNLTLDQLEAIEERLTTRRERLNDTAVVELAAESLTDIFSSVQMSQSQANQLAMRESETADAELEREFEQLFSTLADEPSSQQKLKESQEHWRAFCNSQVNLAGSIAVGGSMRPMLLY